LDHVNPTLLNNLAFASQRLGLIHQSAAGDSAWVMNELIRREADPNLQTGPAAGSKRGMVYHIRQRRFDGAKALLYSGAGSRIKMRGGSMPPLPHRHLVAFGSMSSSSLPKNSSRGEWTGNGLARLESSQV
jgi:hypothetical protein